MNVAEAPIFILNDFTQIVGFIPKNRRMAFLHNLIYMYVRCFHFLLQICLTLNLVCAR